MTNGYKESLIIADPADDVESKKQYKLRRRILAETAKLGQVNLIMPHGENGYWLDIAVKRGWTNPLIIYDSGKSFRAKKLLTVVKSSTISFYD